ncbi:MAG: hypothetical protein ABSG59_03065 [Verrucomicrobiota bacterium]|jgi:hypothetical protein
MTTTFQRFALFPCFSTLAGQNRRSPHNTQLIAPEPLATKIIPSPLANLINFETLFLLSAGYYERQAIIPNPFSPQRFNLCALGVLCASLPVAYAQKPSKTPAIADNCDPLPPMAPGAFDPSLSPSLASLRELTLPNRCRKTLDIELNARCGNLRLSWMSNHHRPNL